MRGGLSATLALIFFANLLPRHPSPATGMEGIPTAIHHANLLGHFLQPPTVRGGTILCRIRCFRPSFKDKTVRPRFSTSSLLNKANEKYMVRASKIDEILNSMYGEKDREDESSDSDEEDDRAKSKQANDPYLMDMEERREWRRTIRRVISECPEVQEEVDSEEKRKKMQKLLEEYQLVVEEDDPNWPDDADGRGFNFDQFFNKITIKNVRKDDEDYDSENEIVWKDDDYIRPIKDITSSEWEETVCKDMSPLIILVHNRYRRPKQNEKIRDELENAVHIIWNCRLPSPRCVAIDAIKDPELVSALKVSTFPEVIFTKSGKILYRDKVVRTAEEFSKIMAFFYYGAAKPNDMDAMEDGQESIPLV